MDGSPIVKMRHGSKGWTVATVELQRGRAGAVEVGDVHTRHRRLALNLAKLPDGFPSTVRRRDDGGGARLGLGWRGAVARWRLGFRVGAPGGDGGLNRGRGGPWRAGHAWECVHGTDSGGGGGGVTVGYGLR
jgi:hypothetical protein